MILNSPYITGSITVTGNANVQGTLTVTGSLSGTATSASLALNSNLLQGTGSVGFSTTASLLEVSSSQQQISASLLNVIANYATTGSNSFRADQSITGSLVVSSTITAQTLVVQTVTSSIVYSSGSNLFGSALGDRQTFTGSVNITGSQIVYGSIGLNKAVPQRQYTQVANANGIVFAIQNAAASNEGFIVGFDATGSTYLQLSDSTNAAKIYLNSSGASYINGGNIGIGVTSPNATLSVKTDVNANGINIWGRSDDFAVLRFQNASGTQSNATIYATPTYLAFETAATERARITSGGLLQINGTSNNATITTDSSANVIGLFATSSIMDNTPRIEIAGTTFASTPSTVFIRANTVRFTLNSASSETMRITSAGYVGIGTTNPNYVLTVKSTTAGANRVQLLPATDFGLFQIDNSGGTVYIGTDSSTGAVFGQGNYSMNIYSSYSSNINFYSSGLLRQQINTSGVITKPYQPFVMGGLDGNQSISLNTFTTLNFSTTVGMFYYANVGSCWNNTTRTFTAPVTGVYMVNVSLLTDSVGQVAFYVNGARKHSIPSWLGASSTTWGGSAMIPLTAGEALTLQGYGNAGTITQNPFHTFFAIYLLG